MRPLLAVLLLAVPVFAAPVPKAVKKGVPTNPDGVWVLTEYCEDGAAPAPLRPNSIARDWVFAGEHVFVGVSVEPAYGAMGPPNFRLIDPDRPTRRVWGTDPAVYELDAAGDTLKVAYAHDGRKELTECKPGQGIHYYVFERVKE
jgi:hypothetical protein